MRKTFTDRPRGRMAPREPLRTLHELAEEFGIPPRSLSSYIAQYRRRAPVSPPPAFGSTNTVRRIPYYRPSEVRAWWAALQEQKRKRKEST